MLKDRKHMDIKDVDSQYEGKWGLMLQSDEDLYFEEGTLIALGDDTDEDFAALADLLALEFKNEGFVHYAHVDTGEYFHVIFGEITGENLLPL